MAEPQAQVSGQVCNCGTLLSIYVVCSVCIHAVLVYRFVILVPIATCIVYMYCIYLSLQPTVSVVPPANVATIARKVAVSASARAVMVPPATVVTSASVSMDVAAAPHVVSSGNGVIACS